MRYTIRNGKPVKGIGKGDSQYGAARVVVVVPTTSDEGPDGVGVAIDVVCTNDLRIKLALQPADFDDEASHVQLVRLAERIQLMATAALNRRATVRVKAVAGSGEAP